MSSFTLVVYCNQKRIEMFDCPVGMVPSVGDTIVLHNLYSYRVATRTIHFSNREIEITVESL